MKSETTQLLLELTAGKPDAAERLFSLLYEDLRGRAQLEFRRELPGHTWQPTALVHEAFLRLIDQRRARWKNRAHFCAIAAQVMRRILVDHAREKSSQKRGGDWRRVTTKADSIQVSPSRMDDVLLVDQLIEKLSESDPQQAMIVQMRFFGGLTVPEVAEALNVPLRTVEAEWTLIRAILRTMASGQSIA